VGEELVEEDGQLVAVAEVGAEGRLLVLIQDSATGVFEDGVGERIAPADLAEDFGVEVVVGILGLPVAAGEVVAVSEGAVGPDEAVADP